MTRLRERIEAIPGAPQPEPYALREFGVGSYPVLPAPTVIRDSRGNRNPAWSFRGSRSYTGIDNASTIPEQEVRGTPEEIRRQGRRRLAELEEFLGAAHPDENIGFIFGNAQDLSLPPGEEVLICNVLGSGITDRERQELLVAANLLLTAGGLLTVRETWTPDSYLPDELIADLGRLGFGQPEVVLTDDPLFDPLTAHYGPTREDLGTPHLRLPPRPDRYFCFAEPA